MKTRTLLILLLIIGHVKTSGKLDIRFISYWSDGRLINGECCDNWRQLRCTESCDPMFTLCIDGPGGRETCTLHNSNTTYFYNRNIIDFGNNIQGKANRFIIRVPTSLPSYIKILVQVYDYFSTNANVLMDSLSKLAYIQPAATEQEAVYTPYTMQGRTRLEIEIRAYCDPDWYGSTCEKYCKATPDQNRFTCHPHTGVKMCFEGWKGDNCERDIDECTERYILCQNEGRCRNTVGSFECICKEGVKGKRCENIINQCALAPCLNGGTCDGNETTFNCACSVAWTGEICAEKVNLCDSAPCNRGNCTPDFQAATGFMCNCDFGWVGDRCSLSVDIYNVTLLGEIDDANRGDLADGLNRFITEHGEIPGKVDVKFTTNIQRESNYTTTHVQLYCAAAVENGSFLQTPLVDRIFESNPEEVINKYLPLPLYPRREEEANSESWDIRHYMPAILPAVGLTLMTVLLLVALCIWIRRSNRSENVTSNDQIIQFEKNVPCKRNLYGPSTVTGSRQDASLCPDGDTSFGFHQAEVVTLDTVCDEISNTRPATDVTLQPVSLQGSNISAGAHTRLNHVDVHRHVTSSIQPVTEDGTLDLRGLPGGSVSTDDHPRHGDVVTSDTRRHVSSNIQPVTEDRILDPDSQPGGGATADNDACYGVPDTFEVPRHASPLHVLPCTSGGGLPENSNYDPLDRCQEGAIECTLVDDNNVENTSEENPYVHLVVMKR